MMAVRYALLSEFLVKVFVEMSSLVNLVMVKLMNGKRKEKLLEHLLGVLQRLCCMLLLLKGGGKKRKKKKK